MEFWKRYSSEITYKWDLCSIEPHEEQPRIEYLTTIKRLKRVHREAAEENNHHDHEEDVPEVTLDSEPHVSFWKTKVPLTLFSLSTVLLMV